MQHEVLAACLGFAGNIICDDSSFDAISSSGQGGFKVSDFAANSFLTPAEVETTNKTSKLGFLYRSLHRFAQGKSFSGENLKDEFGKAFDGLYMQAFRGALDEILYEYSSLVARVEQELMTDSSLSVSFIHHKLRKYIPLFEALVALCEVVMKEKVTGCCLLQLIHDKSRFGTPYVRDCLVSVLWHCHQVFFNQISTWCLYGTLSDPFKEFFIEHNELYHQSNFGADCDEVLVENRDANGNTVVDIQAAEDSWNREYVVSFDMVPEDYFPIELAHKILFSGKAMIILTGSGALHRDYNEYDEEYIEELGVLRGAEIDQFTRHWEIVKTEKEFSLMDMQAAVHLICSAASRCLWNLVVSRGCPSRHLKAIRNYILLGNGDFFSDFFADQTHIFDQNPTKALLARLQFKLQKDTASMRDNTCLNRVSFSFDFSSVDFENLHDIGCFSLVGKATHDKSKGHIILCEKSEDFFPLRKVISPRWLPDNVIGSLWYNSKRDVSAHFSTSFTFSYSKVKTEQFDSISQCGVSLVIHNHGSNALGIGNLGIDGIENSVSICINLTEEDFSDYFELSIRTLGTGSAKGKVLATNVIAKNKLISETDIRVTVDFLSKSQDNTIYSLKVYIDSREHGNSLELDKNINLRESLGVASTEEGAFVGVVAAGSGLNARVSNWSFTKRDGQKEVAAENWEKLRLKYALNWPLQLIFSSEAMRQYEKISSKLVYVKRCSTKVEEIWQYISNSNFRKIGLENRTQIAKLWQLRLIMANLTSNIQYYLQVDVVEAEHSALEAAVDSAVDFGDVKAAVARCISRMTRKSYINQGSVTSALSAGLSVCIKICGRICVWCQQGMNYRSDLFQKIIDDGELLMRHICNIKLVLSMVNARDLSSRLDYNNWFAKRTEELLGANALHPNEIPSALKRQRKNDE